MERRAWLGWVVAWALAVGGAGCRMCQHPYDHCGPLDGGCGECGACGQCGHCESECRAGSVFCGNGQRPAADDGYLPDPSVPEPMAPRRMRRPVYESEPAPRMLEEPDRPAPVPSARRPRTGMYY